MKSLSELIQVVWLGALDSSEWTYKSLEQQFTVQFQNEDQAEQRDHRDHP